MPRWSWVWILSAGCAPPTTTAPQPSSVPDTGGSATETGDTGGAPTSTDPGPPATACTGAMEERRDADPDVVATALDERLLGHPDLATRYRWDRDADGLWDTDLQTTYDADQQVVETVFSSDGYGGYPVTNDTTWTRPDAETAIESVDTYADGLVDQVNTYHLGPDGVWRMSDQEFAQSNGHYHGEYLFDGASRVIEAAWTRDGAPFYTTTTVYDGPTGLTGTACTLDQTGQVCVRDEYDPDGQRTYYSWDYEADGALDLEVFTSWDAGFPVHEEYWESGVESWATDTTWDPTLGLRTEVIEAFDGYTLFDTWTWTCQ